MESSDQPYRFTEVEPLQQRFDAEPVFIDRPGESELSASRVLLHIALFLVTAVTTTLTGAAWTVRVPDSPSIIGWLIGPVVAVINDTAAGNYEPLSQGLLFSFTLLVILGAHEFGHYFACRYYGIRATLPFFIPAPPTITLFGTFGAVIKIKEPIRSRRALFDIGIAGPLAGFALALPAAIYGIATAKAVAPTTDLLSGEGIQFWDPLLFKIIAAAVGAPPVWNWNPVYWAAWGTLLVTALNLFPVGQLDGGHVLYAALGRRTHKWVSRIVCALTAALSVSAFYLGQPPVYLLWTLVLLFLLKVGHPPVAEEEPLGRTRVILAVVALLVFILCFMPFPITTISSSQ
ncbi:MAG TPA: site-2 protease family protein [Blastocatellia bacterium]|nr:site-2 protease family protein [Blastocatellia bacterium]